MYCQYYQGLKTCSNIPINQWYLSQPPGTQYKAIITWKYPVSYLYQLGYDLSVLLSEGNFTDKLQIYYSGNITNYNVYTIDSYHTGITFQASSPYVYAVILVLIAIIGFLIYEITVQVSQNPALSTAVPIISLAILLGAGAYGYSVYKKDKGKG